MSTDTIPAMRDAKLVPLTRAQKLAQDAAEATEVRRLSEHPDVVALQVENVRRLVDLLVWIGIGLGLAFTMVNVQTFAAAGAPAWSLPWLAAWVLDPMVSITLVAVLRAEQITARYQLETGKWANRTKWFAFLATYVMNTWQSWAGLHLAGIVLHSVPPVLVFLAAETAPALRDKLTESVNVAAGDTTPTADTKPAAADTATVPAPENPATPGQGPANPPADRPAPARRRKARKTGRKLLADYVADGVAMWAPGTVVTPAWAVTATGCSKGLGRKVADGVTAALATTTADPAPVAAARPSVTATDQPDTSTDTDEREAA
ncbi:hypothetical protein [Amycolatopsis sp. CA-230715]|uniref:hypothetical protein n=1 Tax=Amycolatopsis sp. CA-230715 TaxID=2745196 RepID=UPI001C325BEF|nr:hypothetical protein [Amycolatopsis sp. CA-230715]QWF80458.1 hypothetical protein HUW46_03880 [Amycolatopsis sp. CA-230715]